MPVLILTIAEYLNKLFKDRGVTAVASLGELCRVMVVAVDLAFMFIVGILGTEDSWTHRAGEVFDMILAVQGCDI